MDNKRIEIIHQPFGNGQPYFQQPFERFPRMPRINETVNVGMIMSPMQEGETVQVEWNVQGAITQGKQDAICIGNSDSIGNSNCERYWLATLPPLSHTGVVNYRFVVQTGATQVTSIWYSYSVGYAVNPTKWQGYTDALHQGVICTMADTNSVMRVQIVSTESGPTLCLLLSDDQAPKIAEGHPWQIVETKATLELTDERCSLIINKQTLQYSLYDLGGNELVTTYAPFSLQQVFDEENGAIYQFLGQFKAPPQEVYVGFGERYTPIDQRGNILVNRVYEQYRNQKLKTYIPIPFFLTNREWGFFAETKRSIEFDMAARDANVWRFEAETKKDDPFIFHFYIGQPKRIYTAFIANFAKPQVPPEWAFGPWMSSNEWNSQKRVEEVFETTKALAIPATTLVIEAWSDEATFTIWNDAQYELRDPSQPPRLADFTFPKDGLWPNPKGMIEDLDKADIRLVLWQIPVLKNMGNLENKQHQRNERYALEHNYVLTKDGAPYKVAPGWFRGSLVIDFENPEAREWWFLQRRYLLEEMGVSGFKTDGGEHLWGYSITNQAGMKGDELINMFPESYTRAYTQELEKTLGKGKGILFSRAGYLGSYNTPMHWAGDQESTWEAYARSVYAMIHASISGIPFLGWDIGGFSGEIPCPELYLRSAAAATFSPVMQYHSEFNNHQKPSNDRTPWNIGEQHNDPNVVPIFRKFANLRMKLIPYLMEEATHAIETSQPFVRPLFFDYPDDEITWSISDTYLLGRSLLVAPVLEEGLEQRALYLPQGEWIELASGKTIKGSCWVEPWCPLDSIPVYLRVDSPTLSRFFNQEFLTIFNSKI